MLGRQSSRKSLGGDSNLNLGMMVDHSSYAGSENSHSIKMNMKWQNGGNKNMKQPPRNMVSIGNLENNISEQRKSNISIIEEWDNQTNMSEEISNVLATHVGGECSVNENNEAALILGRKGIRRRKMKWRVGSFQKNKGSNKQQRHKIVTNMDPKMISSAASIGGGDSVDCRTVKSFHTFHSTETEVVKNKNQHPSLTDHNAYIQMLQSSQKQQTPSSSTGEPSKYSTIDKDVGSSFSDTSANRKNELILDDLSNRLNNWRESRGLPRYDMSEHTYEKKHSKRFNSFQTPVKQKKNSHSNNHNNNYENDSDVSPCGTASTAPSSVDSDRLKDSPSYEDDENSAATPSSSSQSDGDVSSVLAMEPSEDYEESRTIGLFLFDNAIQNRLNVAPFSSTKSPAPPPPPLSQKCSNSNKPSSRSDQSSRNNSYNDKQIIGKPPRAPSTASSIQHSDLQSPYSPSSSVSISSLTSSKINSYLSGSVFNNPTEGYPNQEGYNEDERRSEQSEDEENYSENNHEDGRLWELAGLHALSEGIATPSTQNNQNCPEDQYDYISQQEVFNTGPIDVDNGRFVQAERNLKAIQELAERHMAHGEYREALDVFQEILRGQKEVYGTNHPRIGTALHNIGIVHMRAGNYEKAALVSKCAAEVRKRALGPDHLSVAVSMSQLGIALLEQDDHRKALLAFREVFTIRRKQLGPQHPKVGKVLNNIGCCLFEVKELTGAMLAFQEALDIQRSLMKNPSSMYSKQGELVSPDKLLLAIAATLCNIGSVQLRRCKYDASLLALEEALLIQQSVLGDNHPTVLNSIDSIEFVDSARLQFDEDTSSRTDETHTSASIHSLTDKLDEIATQQISEEDNIVSCTITNLAPGLQRMLDIALKVPSCGPNEYEFFPQEDLPNSSPYPCRHDYEKNVEQDTIDISNEMRSRMQRRKDRGKTSNYTNNDLHWI